MLSLRAAWPPIAAGVAAIVFAVLRPGLTDDWTGGTSERLHWASLGLALWGALGFAISRVDWAGLRRGDGLGDSTGAARLWRQVRSWFWPVFAVVALVFVTYLVLSYPADVDRVAKTLWQVVLAVGVIGGVWVCLNLLVNRAKTNWTVFAGMTAALVAAGFFAVVRGNRGLLGLFADDDPLALFSGTGFLGHVEWPVVGALIWGVGVAAITRLSPGPARMAVGGAIGAFTGWLIADNLKPWLKPQLDWVEIIGFTVLFAAIGAGLRWRTKTWIPGLLMGAAAGWAWAVWVTSTFGVSSTDAQIATIVPLTLFGVRLGYGSNPDLSAISVLDRRARAVVFLGPAIVFITSALAIPAIATMVLSLKDRDGESFVGFDNYEEFLRDADSIDISNWTNIFTSQLFWVAVLLLAAGVIIGLTTGKRRHGVNTFERTGSSVGSIALGVFVFSFAAFSVLRGTFFNNLWWVVTVTTLSTCLGLAIAVLSERAGRFESLAKSLIFMPMAVSFVGASIVWRLQYQPRDVSKEQTGVLNALWVELGQLSHSGWPRVLALVVLLGAMALIARRAYPRAMAGQTFGAHVGGLIVLAYLFYQLLRRSLGGFRFGPDGELLPDTVLFLQNPPFNNVFLMIILIWIQTGFAMVILSAAIKAVPQEFIEAAKVDGATESQIFFNVTLPQILPTVAVIVTTLIVLVTKVFDIVKVTTGGNFGTNVLANDMFTVSFSFFNRGLGSAIAVFILISVLPVMLLNIRRMQRERLAR